MRPSRLRVAVLGDLNWDLVLRVPRLPERGGEVLSGEASLRLGGSATNTARWLALLGFRVRLFAAVGEDSLGRLALAELRRAGVPPDFVRTCPGSTGLCCALVDERGERTLLTSRGANALLAPPLPEGWLAGARWLHLSGYALLEPASREAVWTAWAWARQQGIPVSLDPGMVAVHGHAEALRELGPVDVFLPNREEALALTGEADPRRALPGLRALGRRGFLKLGGEGSLAWEGEGAVAVPAVGVEGRDPVGAGDAFNAGVIAASLLGGDLRAQAGLGNLLGALAAAGAPLTAQNLRRLAQALPEEVRAALQGVLAALGA